MAEAAATATKIVGCEIVYAGPLGTPFDRILDYVGCYASNLSRFILQNPSEPQLPSSGNCGFTSYFRPFSEKQPVLSEHKPAGTRPAASKSKSDFQVVRAEPGFVACSDFSRKQLDIILVSCKNPIRLFEELFPHLETQHPLRHSLAESLRTSNSVPVNGYRVGTQKDTIPETTAASRVPSYGICAATPYCRIP